MRALGLSCGISLLGDDLVVEKSECRAGCFDLVEDERSGDDGRKVW